MALKDLFSFLFQRSTGEERVAQYVIREHERGRSLAEILQDRYVVNRLQSPEQRARLLDRPEIVRAVGAVMGEPEVEAALARDTQVIQAGLEPWVARAQAARQARTDLSAADLTAWLLVVLDGFLGRLATDPGFTAAGQRAALLDVVRRLLAPSAA